MGDHMAVFRSLRELFPQVDPRMLKAVAIEHHKDVDSAVVAVLDEVMPSMTGSVGISGVLHEAVVSKADFVVTLSANHGTRETGSSSSAGHDVRADEANGSVDSAQCTSSTEVITDAQGNVVGELDVTPSYQGLSEQLNFPSHPVPELNDKQPALTNLDDLYLKLCSESNLTTHGRSDNEVGYGGYLSSEYIGQSLMGENGNDCINLNVAQVQDRDTNNTIPTGDCIAQNNSLTSDLSDLYSKFWSGRNLACSDDEVGYSSNEKFIQSLVAENENDGINLNVAQVQERDSDHIIPVGNCIAQGNSLKFPCDYMDMNGSGWKIFSGVPNNKVSSEMPSIEKDVFAPMLDFSIPDIVESSVGSCSVLEQKEANSADTDYNKQQSGNIVEHGDPLLSSKTDLLPDLNSNHFASMSSTHSSHSVSIESLEDSIADAKNNKNDLLPSLELVTKMIGDVELLEEKAKVAKRESSVSGTIILTKVEELKEMLNHAKEANDMHAGEVFGEKSILTTEARELQSRVQRLSDERNSYLAVIEEIRQTLEERLVVAQEEIEAAEKEKIEKEASAQALLSEQEKEMNSIVEESRKLQKEAEENWKLKDFLVERGRIVDTLQGEMAVICEDVSQLKRIVDERVSWSKLQRSTMSSLSSSLHSSLHKSGSSSDSSVEAVESTDKHTVAEDSHKSGSSSQGASPVVEDPDVNERTVEMLDVCDITDKDSKRRDSNEDGWEFC